MTEQSRTPLTYAPVETYDGVQMQVDLEGFWIRKPDYDALELSNARLTAELARYKEAKVPEEPTVVNVQLTPEIIIPHVRKSCYDALLLALRKAQVDDKQLTDDELKNVVVNGCDTLDITRVHKMNNGKWHSTTIFDGDEALLRIVRLAIDAARGQHD